MSVPRQVTRLSPTFSASGLAVDHFPENVGVSGVAGGLLQEMHQHPPQIDGRVVTDNLTERIETGGGDDLVNVHPLAAVRLDRLRERVGVMHFVVGAVYALSGEPLHDPEVFGTRNVFGQPQQGGALVARQARWLVIIHKV